MRSGWFCISWLMSGLNFQRSCFALYSSLHPIPLLLFLPCSFINHSFLLPLISFLTFVLLPTYFLHAWLFLFVPLVFCASFFSLLLILLCFSSVGPSSPGGFLHYLRTFGCRWVCPLLILSRPDIPHWTASWRRVLVEYSTRGCEWLWIIIPVSAWCRISGRCEGQAGAAEPRQTADYIHHLIAAVYIPPWEELTWVYSGFDFSFQTDLPASYRWFGRLFL